MIGEGEQTAYLKSIAGPSVQFLGHQPFPVLRDHLSRCRALLFPGTEDFGILPVEAMASGRPVLAFNAGGARETVSSPHVGFRFAPQTKEALLEAMVTFEEIEDDFDPKTIHDHAEKFSSEVFRERLTALIEQQMSRHNDASRRLFARDRSS